MRPDEFEALLADEGFPAGVRVERPANDTMDEHSHPFEAKALILAGEIRLMTADGERVYHTGQIFHLRANERHTENYGPDGVTYLVGRKA
ncbi:cupin domain-containing protein [Pararobbsia silviterrae]|uniref:Cupin n=1 Tax=Pararobbsia silviterrae TaxID=1792498 RepID=A0A494XQC1_9BURK|nr:cupin domain-containing protein [Pararobbsia silviterrae]RKP51901.1 cupin [Pararobbsia silviterrae]